MDWKFDHDRDVDVSAMPSPLIINFEPDSKASASSDASLSTESRLSVRSMSPLELCTKPCHLLSLPAELRALIWNFYFQLPDQPVALSLSPNRADDSSCLRLLQASRSIYAETVPLFYSLNTFHLSSPASLYHFLSTLPSWRRSHIRSLHISGFSLHYTGYVLASQAFSLLHLCPGLKDLRVDLGTDISWDVLDPAYREAQTDTDILTDGLDVLASLRGIENASIRGISPSLWRHDHAYPEDLLEEVDTRFAKKLRERWLQKKLQGKKSNVENSKARSTAGGKMLETAVKRAGVPDPIIKGDFLTCQCVECACWITSLNICPPHDSIDHWLTNCVTCGHKVVWAPGNILRLVTRGSTKVKRGYTRNSDEEDFEGVLFS